MRLFPILLLALPLAASACGDDTVDPVFLGAIEAGPVADATPDIVQPAPATLGRSPCPLSPTLLGPDIANTVRSIAAFENRALITQPGFVRAVKLGDTDGCPSEPLASFGTDGALAIDATTAAPLQNTRSIVAVSNGTLILDSTGAEVGSCQSSGADLVARLLHVDAEGHVLAAFTKAPVTRLTVDSASASCSATTFDLSSPFVFVQVAFARGGGFVTVEQATATSPLIVARYDTAGQPVSSSALLAAQGASKLCSATGLVDTPKGIFVTDTACRRVVLFEETTSVDSSELKVLRVAAEATFQNSPIGAALTPKEDAVLVAVSQAVENGAFATVERIKLP